MPSLPDTQLDTRGIVAGTPRVSVVMPCRNEGPFISTCLESVLAATYPRNALEILVVDGMSTDGTREAVTTFSARYPMVRLLDNPHRTTPYALNIGVKAAMGEIIVRMDVHARYPLDYIQRCVAALLQLGADNVGGYLVKEARAQSAVGRAIVAVLAHPFGAGNSRFRLKSITEPVEVDAIPFFCVRRSLFDRIGYFNEKLTRSQDVEFIERLRRAGGRTLLVPGITSTYFSRSTMREFCKHNWSNGVWAILPFAYTDVIPVALRHVVPLLFVGSILGLAANGIFFAPAMWLCLGILAAYVLTMLGATCHLAATRRSPPLLVAAPLAFTALHFGYGLGSVWGFLKMLSLPEFWSRLPAHLAHIGSDPRVSKSTS